MVSFCLQFQWDYTNDLALGAPLIKSRDLESSLNTTHHSDLKGVTTHTDPEVLFAYNPACVLGPDVTQGPYCAYIIKTSFLGMQSNLMQMSPVN